MNFNHRYATFPARNKNINEDSVGIFETDDGLLIIVCDAVGGSSISYKAGQICIESVQKVLSNQNNSDYLFKVREAINSANADLINFNKTNRQQIPAASTIDILFLKNDHAFWGHVGDSRIYKMKNKVLHQLTKDHSVIQKLVDEGFITMREAVNHSGKGIIFGALGAGHKLNIDVSKLKLNSTDKHRFFICTDGVSAIASETELASFLSLEDIETANINIENFLRLKNYNDDCSFVIVDVV